MASKTTPVFYPEDILPDSVMSLEPRQRYVVASVIWNGATLRSIAQDLGCSVRTVRRLRDGGFAKLKLYAGVIGAD